MQSVRPFHLWPHPSVWNSILRGASAKLSLDSGHTILCHLATKVARTKGFPHQTAAQFVKARLADRTGALALYFGFDAYHAQMLAERLDAFLHDLELWGSQGVMWPTREQWLAIDRAAAAQSYLDGNKTLTTNLAEFVVGRTGMPLHAAKKHVHARIAAEFAEFARECGFGFIDLIVIRLRFTAWLDSFER